MAVENLIVSIQRRKAELEAMRPASAEAVAALDHLYDIDLTYTSNAIEGNTLSASETQMVIEKGITIGGKSVREHLEVIDHFEALAYLRSLAGDSRALREADVRDLHGLTMRRSAPDSAGGYADRARFVLTRSGRHAFPAPLELPVLMDEFAAWLTSAPAGPDASFEAHRRLVAIHPFNDGNGRTARLLMNLLLLRDGWPPLTIRPADRAAYIEALASEQAGRGAEAFDLLMLTRLDACLADYVAALRQSKPREG
ncbi:MAG: Fic family protein [Alphaproteobacteria bacterium]|nr:Fic family protein [Alphaproteobacteria bacterium]